MIRWICLLGLVGSALADGTRPIDRLPWNATIAAADEEAADRGVPALYYLYVEGKEEGVPEAFADSDVSRLAGQYALARVEVSHWTSDDYAGLRFHPTQVPCVILLAKTDSTSEWLPVLGKLILIQAMGEIPIGLRNGVDGGFYRNARASWKNAQDALAAGNKGVAMRELETVVKIAENCGKEFRFTAAARKAYEPLLAEGRTRVEELKKAIESKDWKKVWEMGHSLVEECQFTVLEREVQDLLDPLDSDAAARKAFEELDAQAGKAKTEALLAEVAKHRAEALAVLRTKVPPSDVPDDKVTLVFWDEVKGPQSFVAAGVWLGDDRAAVFPCDPSSKKMIEVKPSGAGQPFAYQECAAKDDIERKALDLLRKQARSEGRPVVPITLKPGDGGKVDAVWCDGWDAEEGRWSVGESAIDPVSGAVEDRGRAR